MSAFGAGLSRSRSSSLGPGFGSQADWQNYLLPPMPQQFSAAPQGAPPQPAAPRMATQPQRSAFSVGYAQPTQSSVPTTMRQRVGVPAPPAISDEERRRNEFVAASTRPKAQPPGTVYRQPSPEKQRQQESLERVQRQIHAAGQRASPPNKFGPQ